MVTFLFVVNHSSGTNKSTNWDNLINTFLSGSEHSFKIYHLPESFTITQIKDHIAAFNPTNIIAVGGDGTVTMLANIVAYTNIALGILPAGSANGMAKELCIPENPVEALKIIIDAHVRKCDLIEINKNKYCLHLSDIGLNAHLIKHFDEGKLRGKLGYAMVILKTLWYKEKMQVCVKPGIFNPKKIEIIPSTSVEVTMGHKMHFQIDGEYQGKIKNLTAQICEGCLNMIVPAQSLA